MLEMDGAYAVGIGAPKLLGIPWRPAVLRAVERRDPFSRKVASMPTWCAGEECAEDREAPVFYQVVFKDSQIWVEWARMLRARSAALHEGIAFELWSVVIGEDGARQAWKPLWISPDGHQQLTAFPEPVTRWLADSNCVERSAMLDAWRCLPYLENAAGADAAAVGGAVLQLLQPVARAAVENKGTLLTSAAGYVLP